eukprot:TRINITY_DN531_c0_g1_i2.p1 TRINITY_DN531_c0_g1~~TRINITY_DN531_c0_g1_i2.p1  ORF type:complete len:305 (-),score=44.31 TRINITY_DN531_c0_g1_i2:278-1192(-)
MAESILLLCALLLSLGCTASADTTSWLSLFSTLGTKRGISSETSANVDESSLPVPRPWLKHSFEIPKPTIHEGVEIGLLEDEVDRPRRILDAADVPVHAPAPAPGPASVVILPTIMESFVIPPPPPCVGQSDRSVFKSSCIGAAAPGGARQTSGAQFGEPPPPGSISPPLGEGLPQTKILPYPQRKKGMHPGKGMHGAGVGKGMHGAGVGMHGAGKGMHSGAGMHAPGVGMHKKSGFAAPPVPTWGFHLPKKGLDTNVAPKKAPSFNTVPSSPNMNDIINVPIPAEAPASAPAPAEPVKPTGRG